MNPFSEVIKETLERKISEGAPLVPAEIACSAIQGLALVDPDRWAAIRDQYVLDGATATAERLLQRLAKAALKTIPRDGWLLQYPLFPQLIKVGDVFVDSNDATVAQHWRSEKELEALIKSWDCARVTPENRKRAEDELAQRRKGRRLVTRQTAGDPEMKFGRAMELHQASLETPRAKHYRAIASKGGKAKSRRTKNQ